MKAEQLALVEKQYSQKRLLDEYQMPRLSLLLFFVKRPKTRSTLQEWKEQDWTLMADELQLSIEKLIYGGEGLAHAEGNTVFVPFVLRGSR